MHSRTPRDSLQAPGIGLLPEPEAPYLALNVNLPRHPSQETQTFWGMELWRSRKTQAEYKQRDKSQKGEEGRARRSSWVGTHASRPGWQAVRVVPEGQTGPPPLPPPRLQAARPSWKVPASTLPTCAQAAPTPAACPLRQTTPPGRHWHRKEG